jgi:hypothetical protein
MDGTGCRNMYILSQLVVFFVKLNLVNPDFIISMYHLELTPNSDEVNLHDIISNIKSHWVLYIFITLNLFWGYFGK